MDFTAATRILGPNLPKLTGDAAIDQEAYIWLATIYRQFIHPWYSRIDSDGPLPKDCVHVFQQLIGILSYKLHQHSLIGSIQAFLALLDQHLTDCSIAFERCPDHPQKIYMGLHPHSGLPGRQRLEEYLFTAGQKLVKEWLLNAPPIVQSLLATIIQQILSAATRSLSEPWMIHELIIKALSPSDPLVAKKHLAEEVIGEDNHQDISAAKRKQKKKRMSVKPREYALAETREQYQTVETATTVPHSKPILEISALKRIIGTYLKKQESSNSDESILLFICNQFISKGPIGSFLVSMSWPLHSHISKLLNTVAINTYVEHLDNLRYAWILMNLRGAIFPGGFLGPPRVAPPQSIQIELRDTAMKLLNSKAHMNWILPSTFDCVEINQRFFLTVLDYTFNLIH